MKPKLILVLGMLTSTVGAAPCAVFAQNPPSAPEPTLQPTVTLGDETHGRCPPKPGPHGASHDTCREDLEFAFGFSYLHFPSSQFTANTFGLKTDVSWYFNPWLTAEGSASAACGPQSASSFMGKSFLYGGGLRVISPHEEFVRPWVHALIGGMHWLPQTAFGRNGFAAQFGGGADLRIRYWLWWRVEANYVRSHMFREGQENVEIVSGIVYRF